MSDPGPVLTVSDLAVSFQRKQKGETIVTDVVRDVDFNLHAGETVALVGESGSGKSVTSLSVMGLLASSAKIETGSIAFLGRELVGLPDGEMRKIRGGEISICLLYTSDAADD